MSYYRFFGSNREKSQILITVGMVLGLSLFRLVVEIQPQIESFFGLYTKFPVAIFALNGLFVWLLLLMWLTYRRWREAILAEQDLERVLMSISPDSLVVINRERAITMCSGQMEAMFGWRDKELIGKRTDVLYQDRKLPADKLDISSRLESFGFHVGYATGKRKDGSTFPLEVITGTIRFQQGAVVLMRDMTERCRIEDALRQSEIRFEQFMRFFPGFAFIKDQDGRIVFLNEAYSRERGWNIENCLGCKDEDLYREDLARQYRQTDLQVMHENKVMRYVTRVAELDGKARSMLTVKFPLPVPNGDGSVMMVAGLSLDVSEQEAAEQERIKIEQQMQQAQKLESLGVLAGGIAHDFNNLLMGILGHADLALANASQDPVVSRHVESVISSCQRAADLANQLLAYSGRGRFTLETSSLSELVSDLSGLLKVSISKKAALQFDLAESLPAFECDATQIRQVLMNLLVNASDSLESKPGTISLKTGVRTFEEGEELKRISTLSGVHLTAGEYVFARVCDTGIGMDDATIRKIFDPFFTTKKAGHGLGLAAVLGIVRSHGGGVSIESTPGKGSSFTVYFPASNSALTAKPVEPAAHDPWSGEGLILLADDEETVREVAVMMLESLGFSVIAVADGRQALKTLEDRKSDIHALILDVTMPELGGIEVCKEVRAKGIDLPVILSSGYNPNDGHDELPACDNLYFLKKPYRLSVLQGVMREVFPDARQLNA
jgi:two-component system, cell cycle sensor histidine kinase and response regulator CckA